MASYFINENVNSRENMSNVKVTRTQCRQLKCAITQYWVIVSSSYLDGNIWAEAQIFGHKLLIMSSLVA